MSASTYVFKNEVTHLEEKKGLLTKDQHTIEFATIPDFGGPKGMLTPEDLFVGSVNSCTFSTFLYFAERLKLNFISFKCTAEGLVNRTPEGFYAFSEITIHPVIEVENDEEKEKAIKTVELAERYCWISRSIDRQVKMKLESTIKVKPQ